MHSIKVLTIPDQFISRNKNGDENGILGKNNPTGVDNSYVTIHWFRHGLRLDDNPALLHAVNTSKEVYPIFIFDGEVAGTKWAGYNRMRFLHECLEDLDKSFRKYDARLYVLFGSPTAVIGKLIEEWGVTQLTFEQDPEPLWQPRDNKMKLFCREREVKVVEKVSHTLYNPIDILDCNGGLPPLTYKMFLNTMKAVGNPERPCQKINFSKTSWPVVPHFVNTFQLKSLAEMGINAEFPEQLNRVNEWKGGEAKAMQLFAYRKVIESEAFSDGIALPNQWKPDLVGPPTSMSPHLRFGCVSVRRFFWEIKDEFEKVNPDLECPESILTQLIWREYFYCMSVNNHRYAVMEDNPICLDIKWYRDEDIIKKWEMGQTGYPWIDACMNQLRNEGWLHHVARNAVACFLTRGDLWIHWEEGLQIFFKYLLDADWSVCAGNWMWVSSSAFEDCLQCPMCFSPITYGMKMDPSGQYVRRYVPALKDMPLKYLFHPWKAPFEVQKTANCIIGKDYPEPMVDHKVAWRDCKMKMEAVKDRVTDPATAYITPSDVEEIRRFFMLPASSAKDCCANDLCKAIEVSCI